MQIKTIEFMMQRCKTSIMIYPVVVPSGDVIVGKIGLALFFYIQMLFKIFLVAQGLYLTSGMLNKRKS